MYWVGCFQAAECKKLLYQTNLKVISSDKNLLLIEQYHLQCVFILTFIIGVLVGRDVITGTMGHVGNKGGNMAALLLAENVGGAPFLGFIAAVAFATILAVVAGLLFIGNHCFVFKGSAACW